MQVDPDLGRRWQGWSKAEWNDALVDAVFRRRPTGTIIRRIDTTQAWMARVVGANDVQGDAVRAAFLAVFRGFNLSARALFDPVRLTRGWAPDRANLPFFAELYLSLVVASADERTADLGRYRERLAELTGIGAGALIGHELPHLWRKAALWSTSTAAAGVARLVLPSPGSEAIIGIAKRLAFPSYVDQQRLAALLSRTGLDDSAPVTDLLAALRSDLSGFSDHFQTEFRLFRECYQRDPNDAARTPFWQALQEIAWARGDLSIRSTCMLDLELDPSDPHDAGLTVLASGTLPILDGWRRLDDPAFPPSSCALILVDHRAGRVVETLQRDALRAEGTSSLQARRMRLGMRTGLLAFTRQDLDRWSLAERLCVDDDAWLLARHDVAPRIDEDLRTRTGHPLYRASLPGSHAWKLIGPLPVTPRTRALLTGLTSSRLFDARMPSARIELSGSINLPGGVYLRRPLLPSARVDLADSCTFYTMGPDGIASADGVMTRFPDGTFKLPAGLSTEGVARLRIDAHGAEGLVASRTIEVVQRCTTERMPPLSRPDHWMIDDDTGGLIALAQPAPPVEIATLPSRPWLSVGSELVTPAQQIAAAELSSDLIEMFSAMLARRQVIPASRVIELLMDLHGGSPSDAWTVLTTLVENHAVRLVSPRHWRGVAVAAVNPAGWLKRQADGCRVRVIGTLGELLRLRLAAAAAQHGCAVTVHVGNDYGAIGATQFTAPNIASAEQILAAVSIPSHSATPPRPIAAPRLSTLPSLEQPTGISSRWWAPTHAIFGNYRDDHPVALELRSYDRLRDRFMLITPAYSFVTESRRWALLAWAIARGVTLGTVTPDGDIKLSRPYLTLPPSVSLTALIHGGGIVTRDVDGQLVYTSGGTPALVDQLAAWCLIDSPRLARPTDLVRALARLPRAPGVAITLRRHATTLTNLRRSAL